MADYISGGEGEERSTKSEEAAGRYERALRKVEELPDTEKDVIATLILAELDDDACWEKAFANSQDALAKLAAEAMAEERAGETEEFDPDTLFRGQGPGWSSIGPA